jgi:hypothetical protein
MGPSTNLLHIRSFQAHIPLVQSSLVDLLELRRPVLGQEMEPPLLRHHNRELAIADGPGVSHP